MDYDPSKSLPEIEQFISKCFSLIGYYLSGGMGATPLTWSEIESFTNKSGYQLNGWECEQLLSMSRSYCGFLEKAKKPSCLPPYRDNFDDIDDVELMRKGVDDMWDSIVGYLNAK